MTIATTPVLSMTAFARVTADTDDGALALELRAVNSRHLELSFRLPDSLRSREFAWRDTLRQQLARGKVEVSLRVEPLAGRIGPSLDLPLLQRYIELAKEIDRLTPHVAPLNTLELMRLPGVLQGESPDEARLQSAADNLLQAALTAFTAMRAREGAALVAVIEDKLAAVEQEVAQVRLRLPAILDHYQHRLRERCAGLGVEHERLEQELVLFAQKLDVAEELDRLLTHVAEIRRVLTAGGAVGRRLDFLMQELNREANTLGSKAVSADSAWSSVTLKVLIEQMREQIQNLE